MGPRRKGVEGRAPQRAGQPPPSAPERGRGDDREHEMIVPTARRSGHSRSNKDVRLSTATYGAKAGRVRPMRRSVTRSTRSRPARVDASVPFELELGSMATLLGVRDQPSLVYVPWVGASGPRSAEDRAATTYCLTPSLRDGACAINRDHGRLSICIYPRALTRK